MPTSQHPIPDDSSDDSSDHEGLNPVDDFSDDESPVVPVLELNLTLGEIDINQSLPVFNFQPIAPMALDLSYEPEKITLDSSELNNFYAQIKEQDETFKLQHPKSLLFSNFNPDISFVNEKHFSTIQIDPFAERDNIASILIMLKTITNNAEWFEKFGLALKSLQRVKDYEVVMYEALGNVSTEVADLTAALVTRLSLSVENAALVKEDLEKPVVDSINFLFNVGQITTTHVSMKHHM